MPGENIRWGGVSTLRTNLIIHHSIADIFRQVAKSIHILGGIQQFGNLPSFNQRDEVSENVF